MNEDSSNHRLLGYFNEKTARQYENGAFEDGRDEDSSGFDEVTKEVGGELRDLSRGYLRVWSNKDSEEIMSTLESTLEEYGLYGPNNEGPCNFTQNLIQQRNARKHARMTPKRAELLVGLCRSYIHEKDKNKFLAAARRLEGWLDRFGFWNSACTINENEPIAQKSLIKRLNKYRIAYGRELNDVVVDKIINGIMGEGK